MLGLVAYSKCTYIQFFQLTVIRVNFYFQAMTTQEIDDFFQAITQFAETLQSRYESYQRMSQRKSFKVVYQKPTLTVSFTTGM